MLKVDRWVPYFGNQARQLDFVMEGLSELGLGKGSIIGETNSGSHAVSTFLTTKGFNVLANDISTYSYLLGLSFMQPAKGGDFVKSLHPKLDVTRQHFPKHGAFIYKQQVAAMENVVHMAALACAIVSSMGFELNEDAFSEAEFHTEYTRFKQFLSKQDFNKKAGLVSRSDLFDFLSSTKGDVAYMDFAWPWRSGEVTQEYTVMVDKLSTVLVGESCTYEGWDHTNILQNVVKAVKTAQVNYKWVLLSNQSSNCPTHEALLEYLLENDLVPVVMKTRTVEAEDVDNRLRDRWFTEYQYIIKGCE